MILDLLLLSVGVFGFCAALLAHRLARVPASRRLLTIPLTVLICAVVLAVAPSSQGWLRSVAIAFMAAAAFTLTSAWAWKWDSFVARRTDDILTERGALHDKFASHPILKRLMKKPRH